MPTPARTTALGKRLLLSLLLLLLVLPPLQALWPLVPVRPLGGFTDEVSSPRLRFSTLWDNSFQLSVERYVNDHLGFRPWLVRLRNQLAYSGWHQVLASGIFVGKDQNLYQSGTVDAYLGRHYLGENEIAFRARRLRRVQDSLQAHGTQLLFLLAPVKPRILPQYLPDSCGAGHWPGPTNYATVCEQFAKYGVNTLDASALLARWRDQGARYPLFTRTGTHWSGYAVAQVADTLFRRIEALTGRDLPDFTQRGEPVVVTHTADLRYTDNDLGELINLLYDIPPYPTAYPNVVFAPPAGKQRLNALIIGDSFAQSFYGFYPYYQTLFTPASRYWNYNEHVYWPEQTPGESRNVADLNLSQQLRSRQLVLLVANEENLHKLGYNFIDQAFNVFCPLTDQDRAQTAEIEATIRRNPDWLARLAQKAADNNKSLDEIIQQDAAYMHDRQR
ncbi:alginate O-acetyltransferase AlgX-related protein [Hymenobacter baengnokdamensis]|uniref:alginate O-acetyltransferase AlgX-related protein n=1 Tax=Hymenobacter baengnokdamensis TaxID=2615203 RepID=UPI0012480DC9|nr:hypothetical protein [Hymenobacter baengnokdamensis]